MVRVVNFAVRYSANVGDGLIADCLSHAMTRLAPGLEMVSVDLAGRSRHGEATVRGRGMKLRVLNALPAPVRARAVELVLGRFLDRVGPRWRAALGGADLAVFGGGQIFSDADLNFPLKIARAAGLCASAGVPMAVFAAGVARNWSPRGRALFGTVAQGDLRHVALRDGFSREAWSAQMGGAGPHPEICRDPGLLAASCYGRPAPGAEPGPVGICITDPAVLTYHADMAVAGGARADALLAATALALVARGHRVRLFCNGAVEDREALARLAAHPEVAARVAGGWLDIAPPPATPAELAGIIAPMKAVLAHRLHATIVAHAYAIPAVGLSWDRKLVSFFASVGRGAHAVQGPAGAQDLADLVLRAIAEGIDPAAHAVHLDETWAGVARMLAVTGLAARPPGLRAVSGAGA
ncbi:polysaccharide pyruvyl transferase family protein (plasmid) [Paroceanicella profunda]|uniref:Polysaccharide pyruvyl transferase family protein n=1 Tax=Paroceanicella profunda TaxID=2579971 RepID=A0A5B8G3K1_9RHOB|nr:polysaccharide pyruvyl transferase family protein [Paroceanicella profunda]QDL94724.1 polysaccharide pyruvyl transferase family protein [Paroceanicella profunda]